MEIIRVFISYADWITGVINLEYFGAFPSVNKLLINSLPFQVCCSWFSIQTYVSSAPLQEIEGLYQTGAFSKHYEHPVLRTVLDIVSFYKKSSIRKSSEQRHPAKYVPLLNVTVVNLKWFWPCIVVNMWK